MSLFLYLCFSFPYASLSPQLLSWYFYISRFRLREAYIVYGPKTSDKSSFSLVEMHYDQN